MAKAQAQRKAALEEEKKKHEDGAGGAAGEEQQLTPQQTENLLRLTKVKDCMTQLIQDDELKMPLTQLQTDLLRVLSEGMSSLNRKELYQSFKSPSATTDAIKKIKDAQRAAWAAKKIKGKTDADKAVAESTYKAKATKLSKKVSRQFVVLHNKRTDLMENLALAETFVYLGYFSLNTGDELRKDTYLHEAVREAQEDIVLWLLQHGAAVVSVNDFKETPAHICLKEMAKEQPGSERRKTLWNILSYLVERGADLQLKDKDGQSLLDLADAANTEVVGLSNYIRLARATQVTELDSLLPWPKPDGKVAPLLQPIPERELMKVNSPRPSLRPSALAPADWGLCALVGRSPSTSCK